MAALFLLPTAVVAIERSAFGQQLALGLYVLACYFMIAHYFQVDEMWGILLAAMQSISKGNLNVRGTAKVGGQFLMAYRRMTEVASDLGDIVHQARGAAAQITAGAKAIAAGNVELSQQTEVQASTLQETASKMEQLSARVKQNADNCLAARQVADQANQIAAKGGEMVQELVVTMGMMSNSSNKVADIIDTIESIAFQTSILALNAAVEAERAAHQGRGFAMVASEVRNLAARSATAAKEIKALIDESTDSVKQGSVLVDETGRIINEAVSSVRQVTNRIGEIAAASAEQAGGVVELDGAIALMQRLTHENTALVDQAARAVVAFEEEAAKVEATISLFAYDRDRIDA